MNNDYITTPAGGKAQPLTIVLLDYPLKEQQQEIMRCIEMQKFPTKYSMIITDWSI
jgi:hypothetical protein